jgi:hypothetical protein
LKFRQTNSLVEVNKVILGGMGLLPQGDINN